MDTSETYINMCDCEEIKGVWNPIEGDYFWEGMEMRIATDYENWSGDVSYVLEFPKAVWLPRQDQIQEMMRDYYAEGIKPIRPRAWFPEGVVGLTYVLKKFNEFAPPDGLTAHEVKSFEQLWLKFYMYEKHNKVWDGDKWVST